MNDALGALEDHFTLFVPFKTEPPAEQVRFAEEFAAMRKDLINGARRKTFAAMLDSLDDPERLAYWTRQHERLYFGRPRPFGSVAPAGDTADHLELTFERPPLSVGARVYRRVESAPKPLEPKKKRKQASSAATRRKRWKWAQASRRYRRKLRMAKKRRARRRP